MKKLTYRWEEKNLVSVYADAEVLKGIEKKATELECVTDVKIDNIPEPRLTIFVSKLAEQSDIIEVTDILVKAGEGIK